MELKPITFTIENTITKPVYQEGDIKAFLKFIHPKLNNNDILNKLETEWVLNDTVVVVIDLEDIDFTIKTNDEVNKDLTTEEIADIHINKIINEIEELINLDSDENSG